MTSTSVRSTSIERGGGVDEDRAAGTWSGRRWSMSGSRAGAGPRARRVDRPAVRAGRAGRGAGLGPPRRGGDRRRPGGVRALDRGPRRVPRPGVAGVSGRGRGDLRVGDLPAGPLLGGPVAAAGAGPVDRHPAHRRRRRLRPDRLQRPAAAGVEGHHERGRAAPAGRQVAGRETGRRRPRRAAHPAAGRLPPRRSGRHRDRPGRGGRGRGRRRVHRVHRDRLGLPGGRRVRRAPVPAARLRRGVGRAAALGPAHPRPGAGHLEQPLLRRAPTCSAATPAGAPSHPTAASTPGSPCCRWTSGRS